MRVLDDRQLEAKLSQIIECLRESLAPTAIYLYGSYAYGTPRAHSDLDLLVIVEDSQLDPYERDAAAYRALGNIDVPIDIQVYTRAEFEGRSALPVSFERTVRRKGKVVYVA